MEIIQRGEHQGRDIADLALKRLFPFPLCTRLKRLKILGSSLRILEDLVAIGFHLCDGGLQVLDLDLKPLNSRLIGALRCSGRCRSSRFHRGLGLV